MLCLSNNSQITYVRKKPFPVLLASVVAMLFCCAVSIGCFDGIASTAHELSSSISFAVMFLAKISGVTINCPK